MAAIEKQMAVASKRLELSFIFMVMLKKQQLIILSTLYANFPAFFNCGIFSIV